MHTTLVNVVLEGILSHANIVLSKKTLGNTDKTEEFATVVLAELLKTSNNVVRTRSLSTAENNTNSQRFVVLGAGGYSSCFFSLGAVGNFDQSHGVLLGAQILVVLSGEKLGFLTVIFEGGAQVDLEIVLAEESRDSGLILGSGKSEVTHVTVRESSGIRVVASRVFLLDILAVKLVVSGGGGEIWGRKGEFELNGTRGSVIIVFSPGFSFSFKELEEGAI